MAKRSGTAKDNNKPGKDFSEMQRNVIDLLASKVETVVGLRNLVSGDKYFRTYDGQERHLAGKGKPDDYIIIDYKSWRLMVQKDASVKLGYVVRDDSILRPDDIPGAPDKEVFPNAVLDSEMESFISMPKAKFENRIDRITNPEVLHRIEDYLDECQERPLAVLEYLGKRIKILELGLPENFFSLKVGELREFAAKVGINEISDDIRSAHSLREEIISFLEQA